MLSAKACRAVGTDKLLSTELPECCWAEGLCCSVSRQTLRDVQAMTTSQAAVYHHNLLSGIFRTAEGSATVADIRACAFDRLRMFLIANENNNACYDQR